MPSICNSNRCCKKTSKPTKITSDCKNLLKFGGTRRVIKNCDLCILGDLTVKKDITIGGDVTINGSPMVEQYQITLSTDFDNLMTGSGTEEDPYTKVGTDALIALYNDDDQILYPVSGASTVLTITKSNLHVDIVTENILVTLPNFNTGSLFIFMRGTEAEHLFKDIKSGRCDISVIQIFFEFVGPETNPTVETQGYAKSFEFQSSPPFILGEPIIAFFATKTSAPASIVDGALSPQNFGFVDPDQYNGVVILEATISHVLLS